MSSLSWLLSPAAASTGSFSHGSYKPGPPENMGYNVSVFNKIMIDSYDLFVFV